MLVYDLRTATKWRILQGHEAAISSLAFSSAGETLASVSFTDRTLRWWQAGYTGLFSFLGLQGSCQHVTPLEGLLAVEQPAVVGVEWVSATTVAVSCNKEVIGEFSKAGY